MPRSFSGTRRNLLRPAALTPLAAATSNYALEPIKRTGGPLFKPALNAFSFLALHNENMKDTSKGVDPFRMNV
jgi:hypothetical protein